MNPIEEMMKKYGVERPKEIPHKCLQRLEPYNCLGCMKYDEEKEECTNEGGYPQFTPEKQLEIIKLISQRTPFGLEIEEKHKHTIFTINTDFGSIGSFIFEKALAEFLTTIFYYCSTEAQIQQIKEILEGC